MRLLDGRPSRARGVGQTPMLGGPPATEHTISQIATRCNSPEGRAANEAGRMDDGIPDQRYRALRLLANRGADLLDHGRLARYRGVLRRSARRSSGAYWPRLASRSYVAGSVTRNIEHVPTRTVTW